MSNPFEELNLRLDAIENLILDFCIKSEEEKPENYTVKEAANILKCSEQSIHNYIKKGFLPAKKIGRNLLIKSSDVDEALKDVKSLRYKR